MINHEQEIYDLVSTKLRAKYSTIFITGSSLNTTPSVFPTVVIKLQDNPVIQRYSDFKQIENAVEETYYFEIVSNLTQGKVAQCREILEVIDEVMNEQYYIRSFNQQVDGTDATVSRRIARYRKITK